MDNNFSESYDYGEAIYIEQWWSSASDDDVKPTKMLP